MTPLEHLVIPKQPLENDLANHFRISARVPGRFVPSEAGIRAVGEAWQNRDVSAVDEHTRYILEELNPMFRVERGYAHISMSWGGTIIVPTLISQVDAIGKVLAGTADIASIAPHTIIRATAIGHDPQRFTGVFLLGHRPMHFKTLEMLYDAARA